MRIGGRYPGGSGLCACVVYTAREAVARVWAGIGAMTATPREFVPFTGRARPRLGVKLPGTRRCVRKQHGFNWRASVRCPEVPDSLTIRPVPRRAQVELMRAHP